MSKVLVTGGSGFIGGHAIVQLLAAGHEVRTTVRDLRREPDVRATVARSGYAGPADRLSFQGADLEHDEGWNDAVSGCDYVLHVASPFPQSVPKHEEDLIRPARDGALRVLRAAHAAGVKRMVLTSSFAAIGYGHEQRSAPFDEASWTNLGGRDVIAYTKSKTLAERAAWDYVAGEGHGLELAVVNPVVVLGPLLGPDASTSIILIKRLLDGGIPGCPKLSLGLVDVRDVADLHLRAMTHPAAAGERFIASAGDFVSMRDVAILLKARLGEAAGRVPTRELPSWLLRLTGLFDPEVRMILPELDKPKNVTNAKARRMLGWSPRSNAEAIEATARSLADLGMLKAVA